MEVEADSSSLVTESAVEEESDWRGVGVSSGVEVLGSLACLLYNNVDFHSVTSQCCQCQGCHYDGLVYRTPSTAGFFWHIAPIQ